MLPIRRSSHTAEGLSLPFGNWPKEQILHFTEIIPMSSLLVFCFVLFCVFPNCLGKLRFKVLHPCNFLNCFFF